MQISVNIFCSIYSPLLIILTTFLGNNLGVNNFGGLLGRNAGPEPSSSSDGSSTLMGYLAMESNTISQQMNVDQHITLLFSRTNQTKSFCCICYSSSKVPVVILFEVFVNGPHNYFSDNLDAV